MFDTRKSSALFVRCLTLALVVSKPKFEPAFMPLFALLLEARFVNRVVTSPVVNSPVPPTLKAKVAPLFTLILVLDQAAVAPLL